MSNLYQLTNNYETVLNMLYDEDADEQMILDTLETIEGEIEDKADNYAKIIKELEAKQSARKEEAKRLTESAKVFENRVKALKSNLFNSMKATGKTKFATDLFSFNIAKNGGKQPLTIDGEVPEEYTKAVIENDTDKIRQALENGETAESLQISEETLKEIQGLQKQLEENVDVNDLQSIGNDIYDLQRSIIKSKVASQMNVKPEDITLKSYYEASDGSEIESIKIAGEYKSEDILILEDKLPKEVENYISSIVNTQRQMGKVENGEFNKGKIIKEYKEALEESSEFAAGDLKIETKKGDGILNTKKVTKMTYTQTKQKDLQEKESQEQDEER